MAWNAARYLAFAGERTRACRDLAARLEIPSPRRVIDLGCGPGNSTAVLAARWPDAQITGLDSSPEMLAAARAAHPAVQWVEGDIAGWAVSAADPFDLVFSNAALQWVPDHAALLPLLLAHVAPGGALAFQVPVSFDSPAQRLIRELADSPGWRNRFCSRPADWHSEPPGFYYDVLASDSARVDLWQTDYFHVMDGPEAIVEWYRGTGLRPFLDALPQGDREAFLAEYLTALRPWYPPQADSRVLFPFRRLFVVSYRE
jgi:trans-aconitate 2-methyltransferase